MTHPLPQEQPSSDSSDEESSVSLVDILLVLLDHKRLLTLVPLAVGVVALGISFLIKPTFTATAQMMPPQQQQGGAVAALLGAAGGMAGALGSVAGLKNPNDQWIALLKSRPIADGIISEFKLREVYDSEYQFQARLALGGSTRIQSGKDSLITIEVDDEVPERAAKIANSYISRLQELTKTLAVTEASQRRLFFERQLGDAKDKLVKAEIALKDSGVGKDVLKINPAAAVGRVAQAQAAIAAQEVRLSVMRGSMTEANPEYRQALAELQSLRGQLKGLERDDVQDPDGKNSEYIAKYREFKYFETLMELFARQYEMARSDEASNGAILQVVAPAEVPEYKSKPKRGLIAMSATLLAFIACVLWILMSRALSRMAETPEGAEKLAALRAALGLRRRTASA
ncbi:Wzz/FepE/Etk N-terminal domain-containing protein [Leptothrix discophora]|uniref:Wzz/FepE/Etk N-terminal domain-containing protein n=1 Tax=Leptothrix discophora TaxID=89 RepID=A0ABT9G051_LEPDI|nr:Wzz/FepE/Etk N-terminal domain-containing protein [Leptothrix discophora]MDP4299859.1 Wzz/FepE/Etk N-terminal domain-containing protein [Leptothrix discophora]